MIKTEYMGLELRSPVIIASGPLTQNIVSLKKCEEAGCGAVVLKSIFEEQIEADVQKEIEGNADYLQHSSAEDFFASSSRDYYIDRYMKLLTEAKKELHIPVIASVCAKTMDTWIEYAERFAKCGADAIELDYYPISSKAAVAGEDVDKALLRFAEKARAAIDVPLSMKIGYKYSSLANIISSLDKIGIDGVIVTKLDGDTRGGAALSIKAVTGRPILYVGMGEKLSDLEQFYPDRMASRILGMGDVLTLIEKAGAEIDQEKAMQMADKMKKAQFDFDDYLMSMEQMRKMGGLSSIMGMMPGMGALGGKGKMPDLDSEENEKKMARMEAMIHSMTPEERRDPDILNPSRKHRIARGAGVDIAEVNRMVKQFNESRKMMKKLPGMLGGRGGKKGRFRLPF